MAKGWADKAIRISSNSLLSAQECLCAKKQAGKGGGIGPGSFSSRRRLWRSIPQGNWLCALGRWLWAARLWKHSPETYTGTDLQKACLDVRLPPALLI